MSNKQTSVLPSLATFTIIIGALIAFAALAPIEVALPVIATVGLIAAAFGVVDAMILVKQAAETPVPAQPTNNQNPPRGLSYDQAEKLRNSLTQRYSDLPYNQIYIKVTHPKESLYRYGVALNEVTHNQNAATYKQITLWS